MLDQVRHDAMRRIIIFLFAVVLLAACQQSEAPRGEWLLTEWEFSRDSVAWEQVTVPHDWAIAGPFDRNNDLQVVQVTQNFETGETAHTGRTGSSSFSSSARLMALSTSSFSSTSTHVINVNASGIISA